MSENELLVFKKKFFFIDAEISLDDPFNVAQYQDSCSFHTARSIFTPTPSRRDFHMNCVHNAVSILW